MLASDQLELTILREKNEQLEREKAELEETVVGMLHYIVRLEREQGIKFV